MLMRIQEVKIAVVVVVDDGVGATNSALIVEVEVVVDV